MLTLNTINYKEMYESELDNESIYGNESSGDADFSDMKESSQVTYGPVGITLEEALDSNQYDFLKFELSSKVETGQETVPPQQIGQFYEDFSMTSLCNTNIYDGQCVGSGETEVGYCSTANFQPCVDIKPTTLCSREGHYKVNKDIVVCKPFDPSRNRRLSFLTVAKMSTHEEMLVFMQYRRPDNACSSFPESSLPVFQSSESFRKESDQCDCYCTHPSSGFCVKSEAADVAWHSLDGVAVAVLRPKFKKQVDADIGVWTTKASQDNLGAKELFVELVFRIKRLEDFAEQKYFIKTCASVTRDFKKFVDVVEKNFPCRRDSWYSCEGSSSFCNYTENNHQFEKETRRKRDFDGAMKLTIHQKHWKLLRKTLKSTRSQYLVLGNEHGNND